MKRRLLPCPFCGATKLSPYQIGTTEGELVRFVCLTCQTEGPTVLCGNLARDVKEAHFDRAAMLWNRRRP